MPLLNSHLIALDAKSSSSTFSSRKPPRNCQSCASLCLALPDHTLHTIMASMAPPNPGVGEYDQYWRLDTYDKWTKTKLLGAIRSSGLFVSRGLTKEALIAIKRRLDRGLLYYGDQRTSMDMLRKFVKARGISLPTPTTRKAIANVLMDADESRTFHGFQDLPTELREIIYEFYVDAFPEKLVCPTQPPLTRINKLIREEALPIFFKRVRFQLAFFYGQSSKDGSGEALGKVTFRPDFQTTAFLHQLSANPGQIVRKAAIDFGVTSIEGFRFSFSRVLVCAELSVRSKKKQVDKSVARVVWKANKDEELMANIGTELEKRLGGSKSSIKQMLKLEDIYAVRRAAEEGFFATYQKMGEWE
ncbi:hypothetical protein AC579_10220 [Pseudocercospora musae]|uniref:Uncharacterized protein n=1 Tax=Pseudocercospora musae TaxID=113226 RepID=A0A139HE55_9PEZI|nr:hypothetical protein AC579_10220 [Pseudocercospora musae]